MKKRIGLAVLAILIIVFLAGCNSAQSPEIKIGLIAEISGQIPAVGASCRNAALLSVKQINDAGGIDIAGKKYRIRLLVEDTASKADQSAAVAQKLITQNNVLAIVGPNSSGNAIPASEIAEKSKTVLITPWSTNPKTTIDAKTGKPKRYVFRACFTDVFEGYVMGKFCRETLKAQNAAILFDVATEVFKSQSELFRKSFEERGGTIVAYESYTTGDKDFSSQLTKIKAANPDVIFLPSYYTDVPLQVQQAHRLGIEVAFVGSDGWSTPELIKMCGQACEGFYFCNHYSADSQNPATREFVAAYRAAYDNTPDDVAALTYDACGLLWQALGKTITIDRESVRQQLSEIKSYKGVTGDIVFTPNSGDPVKGAVIMQIKDQKFVWFSDANP
jgi:branched-chain amino acid transport system substrate-binding protein